MGLTTVRVKAADRVVEDVVRESTVDQEQVRRRRRYIALAAAIVLVIAAFVVI
jgi:hypothetical protein